MYEPYPVPELAREHQHFRYSSLWTFAKQDLRLLLFFLLIASLIGFGVGYFWSCVFIAFVVFFALQHAPGQGIDGRGLIAIGGIWGFQNKLIHAFSPW